MEFVLSAWRWVAWNVFLAVVPVVTAYLLAAGVERYTLRTHRVPWMAWLPLAAVWLAFLPNTCYLLTEWRHFLFDPPMPDLIRVADTDRMVMLNIAKWGLFFLVYSLIGVLCFGLSIRPVERILRAAGVNPLPLGIAFFLLASLGVYLGLIVRLNSWDIVTRPGFVFEVAVRALMNGLLLKVIILFALLLWLLYEAVDVWIDGMSLRLRRKRKADKLAEAIR